MKKLLAVILTIAMLTAAISMMFIGTSAEEAEKLGFAAYKEANAGTYYDATDFYIYTLEDLDAFAADSKATGYTSEHAYTGKTVHLMADIALDDDFAGIGGMAPNSAGASTQFGFGGTFDGHGYTITGTETTISGDRGKAIFTTIGGDINSTTWTPAVIKNLTVKGFKHSGRTGNFGGGIVTNEMHAGITFENVHLVDCKLDVSTKSGWSSTGFFVGCIHYTSKNPTYSNYALTYKNCSIRDVVAVGGGTRVNGNSGDAISTGLLFGYQWGTSAKLNLTIDNCSFPADTDGNTIVEYFGGSDNMTGAFVNSGSEITAVTGASNSVTAPEMETAIAAVAGATNRKVTFKLGYDGAPETVAIVANGAAVTAPADPTRANDDEYQYDFNGWSPALSEALTADATYTAQWTATLLPATGDNDVLYIVIGAVMLVAMAGAAVLVVKKVKAN